MKFSNLVVTPKYFATYKNKYKYDQDSLSIITVHVICYAIQ